MKTYDCSVRLAGNLNQVVPKFGVTEFEIIVLRRLHGNDSVVGIKSAGERDVSKKDELNRLAPIYGTTVVEEVFKIPLGLDTVIEESPEIPSEEIGEQPAAETQRAAKKAA